jgi:hypothetical protein
MQVNLSLSPGYRLKISRASRMSDLADRAITALLNDAAFFYSVQSSCHARLYSGCAMEKGARRNLHHSGWSSVRVGPRAVQGFVKDLPPLSGSTPDIPSNEELAVRFGSVRHIQQRRQHVAAQNSQSCHYSHPNKESQRSRVV